MPTTRRTFLFALSTGLGALAAPSVFAAAPQNPLLFDGTEITDWAAALGRLTFDTLPPTLEGGEVTVDPASQSALGYNPNRTWAAGTPVSRVLMLGDIQLPNVFGPQRFSLEQLGQMAYSQARGWTQQQIQQWLAGLRLSDFGLAGLQSVGDLVRAIPTLANRFIDQVPPVRDLFNLWQGIRVGNYGQTIRQILAQFPAFQSQVMGALDLSKYGLPSIPDIARSPLAAFAKWAQGRIAEIPGLGDVPWAQFAISTLLSGRFAKIDLVLGAKEGLRNVFTNTVTGSSLEGFNVACGNQSCSHIEFTGPGFKGKRHIINPAQALQGGFGILRWINGGKEGSGWEPFGPDGPKVGVIRLDERTDSVQFGMYFYLDAWVFGTHIGRSPKFIGIPFYTARVKQWIPAP